MSKSSLSRTGDLVWSRTPKTNSELFTLTYGVLVTQLLSDYESVESVNEQLAKMGRNIGVRLIDEYLSKVSLATSGANTECRSFRDTAESIAKVGFKMFLGITADVANFSPEGDAFSLYVYDNPLSVFVELPPSKEDLCYSNLLNGVIEGSLMQVGMKVTSEFVRETEKGDEVTEIRVRLVERVKDGVGNAYKDE